jgi:DNA (cytosine-5)-methyltransferase 1
VLIENVPALVGNGDAFEWVLSDLAALGFDGEWGMVSACAVGAPHTRQRLFIVAYSDRVARSLAGQRLVWPAGLRAAGRAAEGTDGGGGGWLAEPGVGRVADGISDRVDRLRAVGNAVVPAVSERIGRMITGSLRAAAEAA